MPYYRFSDDDIIYNTIEAHPRNEFFIYNGIIYYNNRPLVAGEFTGSDISVPRGHISLHEINVDKPDRSDRKSLIYPFVTKQGSLISFKTINTTSFNNDFQYGDELAGSYPLSASIEREYFALNHSASTYADNTTRGTGVFDRTIALKNTLDNYKHISSHYAFSSSLDDSEGGWDKGYQELAVINVPSIFYGSSIEKGSVELNFYVTGSLIGRLRDEHKNGELIQDYPIGSNGSGSVGGVVLYNEGFLVLTGSWDISNGEHTEKYLGSAELPPTWIHFGAGAHDGLMTAAAHTASSFQLNFNGTTRTPVMTMMAHAKKGLLNYSNNPTYIKQQEASTAVALTSSMFYAEPENIPIKNIVSGAYTDHTASFEKQTYISKIGIYDKNMNLIAVTKVATPVKKTQERELTFKMKLDI